MRGSLLVAGILLASGLPADRAGGIGFPCTLGHASPTGSQPCSPCEPGTFAPFFGETSCRPCPDGTAATQSAAFECVDCVCDDAVSCTHDSCEPDTAVCTATPVAACEPVQVQFTGVVEFTEDAASLVEAGMPLEGSYEVDPLAPDLRPDDPDLGRYSSALRSLEIRVGDPTVLVAVPKPAFPVGRLDMWLDPDEIYAVAFEVQLTTQANVSAPFFSLELAGTDSLNDDSLLVDPDLASFGANELRIYRTEFIEFPGPGGAPIVLPIDFDVVNASILTLTAPEPGVESLAWVGVAAPIALARIRRRRTN